MTLVSAGAIALIALTIIFTPAGTDALGAALHAGNQFAGGQRSQTGHSLAILAPAASFRDAPLVSAGCGRPAPFSPGSSQDERISAGGLARLYRLHIPRGYQPSHAYPLLLSLHGNGSSARTMERLTGFSTLADRADFIAVYPQGVVGSNGRAGWSSGGPGHPTVNDTLFISDALDSIQARLCVDPSRIYAVGFSNGGGMTWVLSCQLAGRIAAFASVSGSYYPTQPPCAPARAVPFLEIHGTSDVVVPYVGRAATGLMPVSAWLAAWVQRDGCASQPSTSKPSASVSLLRWSDCRQGVTIVHIRISGGRHVWPSSATLPGGASATIWSFLRTYTLPEKRPLSALTHGASHAVWSSAGGAVWRGE
jgi:polyhydroxybutyrate depolymerase